MREDTRLAVIRDAWDLDNNYCSVKDKDEFVGMSDLAKN
jgi:hypothetical protein